MSSSSSKQGIPSKHAEAIISAITEVLGDNLENVVRSFVSKEEMQKIEIIQDASLSKFKSELRSFHVRRMEAQGVPSKHAEVITSAITEILNNSLENVENSFVSNGEMQKSELTRDASLSKFMSEVRRMEAQGVPSKHADVITSMITEVWNNSLENVENSFVSKGEIQKSEMTRDASLSEFKSNLQSS